MEGETEQQPQHQTEKEFLESFEWDKDEDTGREYIYFQHGEYDYVEVTTLAKGGHRYIISNGGSYEYESTTSYEEFCKALDEINDMNYGQYCAYFC